MKSMPAHGLIGYSDFRTIFRAETKPRNHRVFFSSKIIEKCFKIIDAIPSCKRKVSIRNGKLLLRRTNRSNNLNPLKSVHILYNEMEISADRKRLPHLHRRKSLECVGICPNSMRIIKFLSLGVVASSPFVEFRHSFNGRKITSI